jgi:hypothetical protein
MAVSLNGAGESHARSLIKAGKVDKASPWSMSADDENAILGDNNWATYASWHLGVDASAADKTKARYKYPFGKGGKVYRSALTAIRQRAGQQGASSVFDAAGGLLEMIDGKGKSADMGELEHKDSRFEYRFTETDAASQGQFEGYGSVFNAEDDFGDMMMPGAFKQTLADHAAAGTMPKMLLNHGGMGSFFASPSPMDMLPIGKWTSVSEDSRGLQCKGRLINLNTEQGKSVYGAMKEGALDGLSIGYKAQKFIRGTKESEPRRKLEQVQLLEISPVTFPANGAAKVASVKSLADVIDIRTAEKLLRDVGGFSGTQAREFISRVKSMGLRDVGTDDDEMQKVKEALTRRRELFAR